MSPEEVDKLLGHYPNLQAALQNQNWYSYTEALVDLTELINKDVLEAQSLPSKKQKQFKYPEPVRLYLAKKQRIYREKHKEKKVM